MNIPYPKQYDISLPEYCKMFQVYALANSSIDEKLLKTRFVGGLATLNSKKEVIRFGVDKPLAEIIAHLEGPSEIDRYRFGKVIQGNDSVKLFYAKIGKYNAILGLDKFHLKNQFIRGLNPENHLEAILYGEDLPLEELVKRLVMIEEISKLYEPRCKN